MNQMSTDNDTTAMLARAREEYGIAELSNEQALDTIKARFAAMPPATVKEGYEIRREGIATLRKIRTTIEKRRVELKADSLAFGRRIDAFAKHWTAQIMAVEEPLRLEKEAVDQAKENLRKAAEEAERKKQEEEARRRLAEEEARLKVEREKEEARLKAIREAEELRMAEERRKLQEAAARLKKIEDEQRAVDERQRQIAQAQELHRIAQEQERAAAKEAEAERLAKIKADQEAVLRHQERLARAEQIKPDIVKAKEYASLIRAFAKPNPIRDKEVDYAVQTAYAAVVNEGEQLENFLRYYQEG